MSNNIFLLKLSLSIAVISFATISSTLSNWVMSSSVLISSICFCGISVISLHLWLLIYVSLINCASSYEMGRSNVTHRYIFGLIMSF